jgi:hypothetical protein
LGRRSSVTFVGIILVVILAGIAYPAVKPLGYILKAKMNSAASQNWPVVAAKVVGKAVVRYPQDNHEFANPIVTYEYSVDGVEYQDTITLSGGGEDVEAEAALSRVGSKIQVRYNPRDPEANVTDQDEEKYVIEAAKVYIRFFVPLLILLIYILFVFLPAFRHSTRKTYYQGAEQ